MIVPVKNNTFILYIETLKMYVSRRLCVILKDCMLANKTFKHAITMVTNNKTKRLKLTDTFDDTTFDAGGLIRRSGFYKHKSSMCFLNKNNKSWVISEEGTHIMGLLHLKSIHPLWKILEKCATAQVECEFSSAPTFCVIFRLCISQRE